MVFFLVFLILNYIGNLNNTSIKNQIFEDSFRLDSPI